MGRGVKFKVRLPNGQYHSVLGPFTGDMTPDGRGYIKVENDPYLPDGDYPASSDNAQQYIALLTEEDLKKQGIELGKDVKGNTVTAREDSVIPNLDDLIAEVKTPNSPIKKESSIELSELPEGSFDDGPKENFDDVKFDIEEFTGDEDYAIYQYQGSLYELTNKFARENPKYKLGDKPQPKDGGFYLDSVLNTVDNLDSTFKKSSIEQDLTVYRGAYVSSLNYEEILKLKEGDYINDSAYLSTSANPEIAKKFAKLLPGIDSPGEVDEDGTFIPDTSRTPILYKINLKAGQPALRVRDHTGQKDFLDEEEVLLPRNSKIKVTGLSKSIQPLGGLNMEVLLIEGEYETEPTKQPSSEEKAEELPISTQKIKELYDDISNLPTEANEKKLAKDLYELMLDSGLTTEEIILAGKYKVEESIEKQEEYALDLITKLAGEWNSSTEFDSVKKLQKIAEKVFKPEGTYKSIPDPKWLEDLKNTKSSQVFEVFLKAMYDNTQKYFADKNIKKLVVYRGLSGPIESLKDLQEGEIGGIGALQGAPMASWTLDKKEAGYFAGKGVILRSEIPVSSVLSMPFTGLFGVHSEQELVVLGMPSETKVTKYDINLPRSSEGSLAQLRAFAEFEELDDKFDASKPLEPESLITNKADLTQEEAEALKKYTGDNWHTKLNNYLRYGALTGLLEGNLKEAKEKLKNQLDDLIKPLDEAIEKTALLEDTVLYRGTGAFDGGGEFGRSPEEILENLKNNTVTEIIDKGFISTSYDYNSGRWFGLAQASSNPYTESDEDYEYNSIIVYKINAKKGQKAHQVTGSEPGLGGDEKEVILPRDTKFKVLGYSYNKSDPEDPDTYDEFIIDLDIVEPATIPEKPVKPSQWDGIPFDPKHMEDNGETSYYIREPNPPKTMYHVAPKSIREDALKNGLDPKDLTHNTGLGAYGDDKFEDEHLWTKNDDGEYWAYEYRPIGVYMFDSLEEAQKYASENSDIYEIDTVSNNREIIRDPVSAANWDYLMDEEKSWVSRYIQPQSLKLLNNPKSSDEDADIAGVIDVVSEEATKERLES
jgi:hypothetical protein